MSVLLVAAVALLVAGGALRLVAGTPFEAAARPSLTVATALGTPSEAASTPGVHPDAGRSDPRWLSDHHPAPRHRPAHQGRRPQARRRGPAHARALRLPPPRHRVARARREHLSLRACASRDVPGALRRAVRRRGLRLCARRPGAPVRRPRSPSARGTGRRVLHATDHDRTTDPADVHRSPPRGSALRGVRVPARRLNRPRRGKCDLQPALGAEGSRARRERFPRYARMARLVSSRASTTKTTALIAATMIEPTSPFR